MQDKLTNLLKNSYSPYSNFKVASIVVMKDNNIFSGVNVENASFGATICAERSAIVSAISAGYKKYDFEKLYVMVDSDKISSSCFLCRQVISEFFEENKEIVLMNKNGDYKTYLVKELCPVPFNDNDLNI
ncbi:MAG: cytidine deaminase [Bacilli bacterium]|nr:cytidine deaminase [Bacilli bacterium]